MVGFLLSVCCSFTIKNSVNTKGRYIIYAIMACRYPTVTYNKGNRHINTIARFNLAAIYNYILNSVP